MVRRKPEEDLPPLPPPAKTLEGREQQLTAAAYDLIEKRIQNGTASAQETVHFARQGSVMNQLALEKVKAENELLRSRVKELESRTSSESMYSEALKAFRGYAGIDPIEEDDGYDEDVY